MLLLPVSGLEVFEALEVTSSASISKSRLAAVPAKTKNYVVLPEATVKPHQPEAHPKALAAELRCAESHRPGDVRPHNSQPLIP